jgi:uncharacterized membrane protein YsdA (DUF1294 family)
MSKHNPYLFFSLLCALIAGTVTALCLLQFDATLLISFFIGINAAAIITTGFDKSLARSGALRMPETISYVIALLGGSPGTVLGMHVFKHKQRKAAFQFVLLLIFVAQLFIVRALTER